MRHTFLLADDSALARRLVRQIVSSREEWQVCGEASDGDEAVEKARATTPDVAIIDISMPQLNGIEAARQIRREFPAIRLVTISSFDAEPFLAYMWQIGVDGFVPKSSVETDLIPAIEAVLGGKSYIAPAHRWVELADTALPDIRLGVRQAAPASEAAPAKVVALAH